MTNQERIEEGLKRASFDELVEIVSAAIRLKTTLYRYSGSGLSVSTTNDLDTRAGPDLFRLRKSLEGIWGHDLPVV